MESMEKLESLELGLIGYAFNGVSLHAFRDECVRRGLKVQSDYGPPAPHDVYGYLNCTGVPVAPVGVQRRSARIARRSIRDI